MRSKGSLVRIDFTSEMKKLFVAVTIAYLGAILTSISAQGGGLAFDGAGNLYVADEDKHAVLKYTPDGTKSLFAPRLNHPLGLSFDGEGNLFVSDGAATDAESSILKFTPDGRRSTFSTGISSVGMAFDRSGNLFVSQGDSIFKFTPEGARSTFVVSKLANFGGLAFDGSGNLFVLDRIGRSIFKFTPDGTKSTFATGLKDPSGLAPNAAGIVYVTVAEAGGPGLAILKFNSDGTQSTFASALDIFPTRGMAVDRSANLFVWDGHTILKVDSSGTPITFASDWLSPDKQWEYKCCDGVGIVKAGTTQVVLDLSDLPWLFDEGEILWAPNSKRFAVNYRQPARHMTYETVAFYQLRGDSWVTLHSPVDEASKHTQLAQLARKYSAKNTYRKGDSSPAHDHLKVRSWTDANTAILYAYSAEDEGDAAALFTLKFDEAGNWKIVKMHQLSKKELEEKR